MRIVSFNIQNRLREKPAARRHRIGQIADVIQAAAPDAVCLQEVSPAAWKVLKEHLPMQAAAYGPRSDDRTTGEAVPVLCMTKAWRVEQQEHFWLSETPDRSSVAWGAVHPRICSSMRLVHGRGEIPPLWIMNVHLSHNSSHARQQSLKLLHQRVEQRMEHMDEVILCGDFNMPPYKKELLEFSLKTSMKNATHFHPVEILTPTFLGWGPFRFAKARIDHCFHSKGWTVKHYRADLPDRHGCRLSDHRMLVVDLLPAGK